MYFGLDCRIQQLSSLFYAASTAPQQIGQLSGVHIQRLTESIKGFLAESTRATDEASTPYITVPSDGVPIIKRCGVSPDNSSDIADRNDLFNKVHAPISEYRNGDDSLSSILVKWYRCLAFLGLITVADIVGSGITEIPQAINGSTTSSDLVSGQM